MKLKGRSWQLLGELPCHGMTGRRPDANGMSPGDPLTGPGCCRVRVVPLLRRASSFGGNVSQMDVTRNQRTGRIREIHPGATVDAFGSAILR
jgi:hypothetical protein